MSEIIINEIKRYVNERLVGVEEDVTFGQDKEHDPMYARFWEGRLIADEKHRESLIKILEIINEG